MVAAKRIVAALKESMRTFWRDDGPHVPVVLGVVVVLGVLVTGPIFLGQERFLFLAALVWLAVFVAACPHKAWLLPPNREPGEFVVAWGLLGAIILMDAGSQLAPRAGLSFWTASSVAVVAWFVGAFGFEWVSRRRG
jgi:hypothetical protein